MLRTQTRLILRVAAVAALRCGSDPVSGVGAGKTVAGVGVTKSVLLDPTTYVPAAASYSSQHFDWKSSQPLFRAGWLEQNPRFTISGRANDLPVSYGAGHTRILTRSLEHLQWSVLNNAAIGVVDRVLTERYPNHRKLIRALSWVERMSFASYTAYLSSINYFEQAQENARIARRLAN